MIPQELIRRKRDGFELSDSEIAEFIKGVTTEKITEGQVAAFAMAVFFKGLSVPERVSLTKAMTNSGAVLSWDGFDRPIVDKHSTGGVGDKVSIMLAPIVAACGAYVPMICGRGLGHTGGTYDKLQAIPGFDLNPGWDKFKDTVRKVGCSIIGQTQDLAPADKRIYAIRDVTGTVESLDLITASILSKKIAAGLEALVMDVKVGSGAFMQTMPEAEALARSIIDVANMAGVKTSALITDMDQVLGRTAGNAIEMIESVEFLKGENLCPRLKEITLSLCAEMLVQAGLAGNAEDGFKAVEEALMSGKALEIFSQMVHEMGGPVDFVEKYKDYLQLAPICRPVYPVTSGYVQKIQTRDIGLALIELGGGRRRADDVIDHSVGFDHVAAISDFVSANPSDQKPLAIVYAKDEADFEKAAQMILNAFKIADDRPVAPVLIRKYMN